VFRLITSLFHGKDDSDALPTDISSVKGYNFTNWDVSLITLLSTVSNCRLIAARTIISFFTMASRPGTGTIFLGAERIKHNADHLSAVTSEIRNVWRSDYVLSLPLFTFLYRFVRNKDVNIRCVKLHHCSTQDKIT